MSTISASSAFAIGDKVWIKSMLDTYLDTSTSMKPILMLDVNKMLYKVDKIDVKVTVSTTTIYYTVSLVTAQNSTLPTAISETSTLENISESSLYTLAQGKTAISTKIADLNSYLATIT